MITTDTKSTSAQKRAQTIASIPNATISQLNSLKSFTIYFNRFLDINILYLLL